MVECAAFFEKKDVILHHSLMLVGQQEGHPACGNPEVLC